MKIEIKDLDKVYRGGVRAVDNVSLEIENGMFGLLGPNGAGKTTLMRILVTLMKPSSGTIKVNGLDIRKDRRDIRAMMGYLPQDFRFFSKLTTWEFLDYAASLAGLKRKKERINEVDRMLEDVGLFEARDRKANKLSGGMKRRLGIAQALIGDPKVVVVDEPTTGLDPEERIRFRNLLSEMSSKDIIIILSTHIVGDISSSCRQMALLNEGALAYAGSPDELIEKAKGRVWKIKSIDSELQQLQEKFDVISTISADDGWEVTVVTDNLDGYPAVEVEPDLEHAYVNFVEYELGQS